MVPKVMDEFDCAALLDESNTKIWQWKKIVQCLKLFMDIYKVCVPDNRLQLLGVNESEIHHGTYDYADPKKPGQVNERVRYWTKEPVPEFLSSVASLINGYSLNIDEIDFIHVAHGGDHGKAKFRFASKVVIRMKDGTYYDDLFGLSDVKCKKDHAKILENTIFPKLMEGINEIETSRLVFTESGKNEDGKPIYTVDLQAKQEQAVAGGNTGNANDEETMGEKHVVLEHVSFLVGDLAFLSVMLGKEGFESYWCNWCNLNKTQWQETGHKDGVQWLFDLTVAQAKKNQDDGLSGIDMMGVKRSPYCKIPFERTLFSVLHALIGIGNNITKYLEHFIDLHMEKYTEKERALRNAVPLYEAMWREAGERVKVWDASKDGKLWMKRLEREAAAYKLEIQFLENDKSSAPTMLEEKQYALKLAEGKIVELNEAREKICSQRESAKSKLSKTNKDLVKFIRAQKKSEKSL